MDSTTLAFVPIVFAVVVGVAGHVLLHSRRDPVALLSLVLMCLMLISANQVLPGAGAIGTPAIMLGLAALGWWVAGMVVPSLRFSSGTQPARWIVLGYAWFLGLSYVIGHTRALTALESSGSDRGMIRLAAMCGVALLAADGIRSRERLEVLLRRLVWLGGFFAIVGLIQFFFRFDLVPYLTLPGLTVNDEFGSLAGRSGFTRPPGTSLHSIEFSVVLSMLLPLAVHFTLYDATKRRRRIALACAIVIAMGIPMSLSRTGIIAMVVVCLFMMFAWSWRQRLYGALAGLAFGAVMYVMIPGLLGSIRSMFVRLDSDPSVTNRIDRMPRVMDLWSERFWFGRGTGTYSPEDYFLLDNQLYVTAIETGIVGLAALVGFLVAGIWLATATRRMGADVATANLSQALAAPLAVALVSLATFDALFYHILTTLIYLFIGCAGALWRIQRSSQTDENGTQTGQGVADRTDLVRT